MHPPRSSTKTCERAFEAHSSYRSPFYVDILRNATCINTLNHFATYLNQKSCLAHLKVENDNQALSLCNIEHIKLPCKEHAQNFGDGQWLKFSCNPHSKMGLETQGGLLEEKKMTGCQACFVRLPCGGKLMTKFVQSACFIFCRRHSSVLNVHIELALPLRHLMNSLALLSDLSSQPNIETIETAEPSLIGEIQNRMTRRIAFSPIFTHENSDKMD